MSCASDQVLAETLLQLIPFGVDALSTCYDVEVPRNDPSEQVVEVRLVVEMRLLLRLEYPQSLNQIEKNSHRVHLLVNHPE